jgi:DNA-directed RNA polymerase sigma subunit (sigma70/sigma32)
MDGRLGMTLGEVGDAMGLSKERVRQIQKSALGKLREVLAADPSLQ